MDTLATLICMSVVAIAVMLVSAASAIRIVPEYQRLVIFRLGRLLGVKGPGIVFLLPILDHAVVVDLREQKFTMPQFTAITHEDIPIALNLDLYYKVIDPQASVSSVANVGMAAAGLAVTMLRTEIGGMRAVEVVAQPGQLGQRIRERLDETVGKWGIKATNVEIREITPPADVAEALARQASQERVQRALGSSPVGSKGVAQTSVHVNEGKVVIDGQTWDAVSKVPIPPQSAVRVRRIILEVEPESNS